MGNIASFDAEKDTTLPSDHAPITVIIDLKNTIDMKQLLHRASILSQHYTEDMPICRKPIPLRKIMPDQLVEQLLLLDLPSAENTASSDAIARQLAEKLYICAEECISKERTQPAVALNMLQNADQRRSALRWNRILSSSDPKLLWRAIDWRGEYDPRPSQESPPEIEFQTHMESLLNPPESQTWPTEIELEDYNVHVPILDDPFQLDEVKETITKHIKPRKGAGPDGVSPGILHMLPVTMLLHLLSILNLVFWTVYPACWTPAKLVMLFKKGNSFDCNNYRGISIINCLAKLYDYMLNNRLIRWYKPCREQAGAQAKRGCIEHIVSLRLLFEYCKRSRKKLFVVFVDFSKAYDRVPRGKLFNLLKSLGCGKIMLQALIRMYSICSSLLGNTLINSNIGVRQGAPTSCFLFVLYVDVLIKMLKLCGEDSFLGWLCALMLMDDTVIVATSREMMNQRLDQLNRYCESYGMVINQSKTQFMAINGKEEDKKVFKCGSTDIIHCSKYTYLGAIFTADGSGVSSLKEHLKEKKKHLNRLYIFLATNYDAPFQVKKKVFEAAFTSAILYGCESWVDINLKPIKQMYMSGVKALLGVRKTIPESLCLLEAGIPPVESIIHNKQAQFFSKMLNDREGMQDDPFWHVFQIVNNSEYRSVRNLKNYIKDVTLQPDTFEPNLESLQKFVRDKDTTRFKTYLEMNPNLTTHPIYDSDTLVNDSLRIKFTRIRLSSHCLRIELGRWQDSAHDTRVCSCDNASIQDEKHIFQCPLTAEIRRNFDCENMTIDSFFDDINSKTLLMLSKCLDILEP